MKKLFSIMLALAMVFTTTPLLSYAVDEAADSSETPALEVVESAEDEAVEPTEVVPEAPAVMADGNGESPDGDGEGDGEEGDSTATDPGEPLIDEFDKDNSIWVFYDESDPHDDPHFKDRVLSASFKAEKGYVYFVTASVNDPEDWETDYESETIVTKGDTVLDSYTGDDYNHAWLEGSAIQDGDVVTVSLKNATAEQGDYSIGICRGLPYTVSELPSSVTVGLGKVLEDADETEPDEDSGYYYWAEYSIDNENIASIEPVYYIDCVSLNIKGKTPGKTVVTATLPNGRQYRCTVTVSPALKVKAKTIRIKESFANSLIGYKGRITWSTSNKAVATVSSKGVIRGVKKGTATITAKAGGKTYKCTVKVLNPVLSKTSLTPLVGQKYKLTVKGGNGTIKWSSSNKAVATVTSKGVVAAKKAGSATITAVRNGIKMTCKVTVVKKISINNTSELDMVLGADGNNEYVELSVKGGIGDVTWSIDDESVAKLGNEDGDYYVEAVSVGETVIRASRDGKTATCRVYVTAGENISFCDIWELPMDVDIYYHEDDWKVKVVPKVTGYITVKATEGTGSVRLEDEDEDTLSEDIYIAEDDPYAFLGVKAGRTYYLAFADGAEYINTEGLDEDDDGVWNEDGLREAEVSVSKSTNKCGYSKMANAKTIKRGALVKGVFYGGDERAQWYKFKLTRPAKVRIRFHNVVHQAAYITLYQGSKIVRGGGPHWYDYDEYETFYTTGGNLKAGTYYIRITPDRDYYCTGWYTLKWY